MLRFLALAVLSFSLVSAAEDARQSDDPRLKLFAPGTSRVLILTGRNNHEWRKSTSIHLRDLLVGTGKFDVRVIEEPTGITASTLLPYDAIVFDYNGPRLGSAAEAAIEAFVRQGKGIVFLHASSYAFAGLPLLNQISRPIGVTEGPWDAYHALSGALYPVDTHSGHGKRHVFQVRFVNREHPVASSLPETFWANDELYHNLRMHPSAKILATAYDDPAMRGTGKHEPIAWTIDYGRGRSFHTTLGHDLTAKQQPGFVSLFRKGVEWAASAKITPDESPQMAGAAKPVLIVAGEGSFSPAIYAAIQETQIPARIGATEPSEIGSVLLLYGTGRISDRNQKLVKQLATSGHGLVVLGAIGKDDTPWGRWLAAHLGANPESLPEQRGLVVSPADAHPVTTGLPPIRIEKADVMTARIRDAKPLLTTGAAQTERPVAWVRESNRSRIAALSLGEEVLNTNPAFYVQLLRQALLWASAPSE